MADGVHRTYRSPALLGIGGVGLVLAVVLTVWVLLDEAGRGHWLVVAAAALWGILIATLIVEVFLRPEVSTTAIGVVLVNPFRTVVIPWAAVRGVETELALQILTERGRHTSWAATGKRNTALRARGLRGASRAGSLVAGATASGRTGPPSVTELLRSGASRGGITAPVECMLFIETGLSEWRMGTAKAGGASPGDDAPRVEWHRRSMVATAVPAVLLLAVTLAR
jgi:Bacterial PH domain